MKQKNHVEIARYRYHFDSGLTTPPAYPVAGSAQQFEPSQPFYQSPQARLT
ncbi:hypothetical protein [Zhongshania marina]|uniref:hypothetical protein n=1 Tax=Zhongshania marina TaxID=2304603 RepID=UPI001313DE6B